MKYVYYLIVLACAAVLIVAGCSVPVPNQRLSDVEKHYRPDGAKPKLPELKADSSLKDFLAYAILNNPKAEAAFYNWKEAVHMTVSASFMPSPELTFNTEIINSVRALVFGFMQEIPPLGKRALDVKVASQEALKKRFLFDQELLKIAFNVEQVYYQGILLNEQIRLTNETIMLVDALGLSVRTKYQAGLGNTEDLVTIQSEQSNLQNKLASLTDSLNVQMANWHAALGIPPDDEIIVPLSNTTFVETALPSEKDILKEALAKNLDLKVLSAQIEEAQVAIDLAYNEKRPSFKVGLSADTGQHPWMGMPSLNMSLPIWSKKIRADISAAKARQKQAQTVLTAGQIDLAVIVAQKAFSLRELQRQCRLIKEQLIPLAEISITSLEAGYQTGKTDFMSLLNAKRDLINLRMGLIEATIQREVAFADITLLVISQNPVEIAQLFYQD